MLELFAEVKHDFIGFILCIHELLRERIELIIIIICCNQWNAIWKGARRMTKFTEGAALNRVDCGHSLGIVSWPKKVRLIQFVPVSY